MSATTRLVLNTSTLSARNNRANKQAQIYLDNEVLRDSEPYVPFASGNLARSGQRGTKIGSGKVLYNAPYARSQYYTKPRKSTDRHPHATMHWFEKAKAVNLQKWITGAKRIYRGGY